MMSNDPAGQDRNQTADFLNEQEPLDQGEPAMEHTIGGLPTDQAQITGKKLPMTEPDIGRELTPLERAIVTELKTVYDPEIPVDIYELGLIYGVEVDEPAKFARIEMTLTAPGCPVAGYMPDWVKDAVLRTEGIDECHVEMVWDPPWNMERMSDQARLELNLF